MQKVDRGNRIPPPGTKPGLGGPGKPEPSALSLPRIDSFAVAASQPYLPRLEENGFQLLLADNQKYPQKELDYLDAFDPNSVDGVILIVPALRRHTSPENRRPQPCYGQRPGRCPSCRVSRRLQRQFYDVTRLSSAKAGRINGLIGAVGPGPAGGAGTGEGLLRPVREGRAVRRTTLSSHGFSMPIRREWQRKRWTLGAAERRGLRYPNACRGRFGASLKSAVFRSRSRRSHRTEHSIVAKRDIPAYHYHPLLLRGRAAQTGLTSCWIKSDTRYAVKEIAAWGYCLVGAGIYQENKLKRCAPGHPRRTASLCSAFADINGDYKLSIIGLRNLL